METQINDNLKNNKKPINLIGDKGYINRVIIEIKFIMKINKVPIKLITPKNVI